MISFPFFGVLSSLNPTIISAQLFRPTASDSVKLLKNVREAHIKYFVLNIAGELERAYQPGINIKKTLKLCFKKKKGEF